MDPDTGAEAADGRVVDGPGHGLGRGQPLPILQHHEHGRRTRQELLNLPDERHHRPNGTLLYSAVKTSKQI